MEIAFSMVETHIIGRVFLLVLPAIKQLGAQLLQSKDKNPIDSQAGKDKGEVGGRRKGGGKGEGRKRGTLIAGRISLALSPFPFFLSLCLFSYYFSSMIDRLIQILIHFISIVCTF